ncbi:MAG: O-antigen ligase family protein [Rhizomicrobium sp.]
MKARTSTLYAMAASLPLLPTVVAFELLAPSEPAGSLLFYLLVPAFLARRIGKGWRPPWHEPTVSLGLALILWSTICLAWDHDPSGCDPSRLLWLLDAFCTLVFFLAWLATDADLPSRAWLVPALLVGGAGNALFAIVRHLLFDPAGVRMWGWGITGQPVPGSAIMAVLFVVALDRFIRFDRRTALPHLAAMILFALFMILSNSRGPVLAVTLATAYRLSRERWQIAASLGLAAITGSVGLFAIAPHWAHNLLTNDFQRGTDLHVTIWRAALAAIAHRPVLGYGPAARLPINIPGLPYPFPHDLYLSTLFYSGAVGLVLLALLVVAIFRGVNRLAPVYAAICLVPLVAGFTDLSQLIKGPSAIWFVFWVPILLNITARLHQKGPI